MLSRSWENLDNSNVVSPYEKQRVLLFIISVLLELVEVTSNLPRLFQKNTTRQSSERSIWDSRFSQTEHMTLSTAP